MNIKTKVSLGILIVITTLFIVVTKSPDASASANAVETVSCPKAPFVPNAGGWSVPNLGNIAFVKAVIVNKTMTCRYKTDSPVMDLAIYLQCRPRRKCVATDNGFDLGTPGTEDGE